MAIKEEVNDIFGSHWPRLQASFTFNGDMIVVRENDPDKFKDLVKRTITLRDSWKSPEIQTQETKTEPKKPTGNCEICNSPLVEKSGVKARTGKSWRGIFCSDRSCKREPTWLSTS